MGCGEAVRLYGAGITSVGLTRRMTQADLVARAVDLDMVEAGCRMARPAKPCVLPQVYLWGDSNEINRPHVSSLAFLAELGFTRCR